MKPTYKKYKKKKEQIKQSIFLYKFQLYITKRLIALHVQLFPRYSAEIDYVLAALFTSKSEFKADASLIKTNIGRCSFVSSSM